MRQVDQDFQHALYQFNESKGGPARVDVAWNPIKERWQVFVIPQQHNNHPLAHHDATAKLMQPFPDGSGKRGVLLFTWCERHPDYSDAGFKPLDSRVFETLNWADTYADRRSYERMLQDPQLQKEMREKKNIRDLAGGGVEYWSKLDSLTLSMNPATKAGASWRHRIR